MMLPPIEGSHYSEHLSTCHLKDKGSLLSQREQLGGLEGLEAEAR